MWETWNYRMKLLALAGDSDVMIELLLEDAKLVEMIKGGGSRAACLEHINVNF